MTDFQPIGEEALEMLSAHPRFESITEPMAIENSSTNIRSEREIPTKAAEILSTA